MDIIEIYEKVFGYRGLPFPFKPGTEIRVNKPAGEELPTYDAPEGIDMLGVPIFLPCTIAGYELPNEPLITITGANYIVKTKVAGLDGTVKERICEDDYIVTIQGIMLNNVADDLPETEMSNIIKMKKKKVALDITNRLTRLFGIDQIVIERISFPGVPGQQSAQAYRIDAISDKPVELELREELL